MALKKKDEPEYGQEYEQNTYDEAAAAQAAADRFMNDYNASTYNYDMDNDPVLRQAREAYRRQAQAGAKNAQAGAARLTGGYGNSYGAVAAQQQYNDAMARFNESIPQFEQNAYNRYLQENNKNLQMADYYAGRADTAYQRAYQAERDAYNDEWTDKERSQRETEWAQSNEKYELDKEWNELLKKRQMEEWSQADEERLWDLAQIAAQYDDYSYLNALNVDTSKIEADEAEARDWTVKQHNQQELEWLYSNEAKILENTYQELLNKKLNDELTYEEENQLWAIAEKFAQYDDYSKINELGVNTSKIEADEAAAREWNEKQKKQQEIEWGQQNESYESDKAWTEMERAQREQEWLYSNEAMQLENEYQVLVNKKLKNEITYEEENRLWEIAQIFAQYEDYSKINELGVDTTQLEADEAAARDWTLKQQAQQEIEWGQQNETYELEKEWNEILKKRQQQEWTQEDENRALEIALTAAQYKDYSKLSALGFNMATQQQRDKLDLALQWMNLGDFSLLEELGIKTDYLRKMQQADVLEEETKLGTTLSGNYGKNTSSGNGGISTLLYYPETDKGEFTTLPYYPETDKGEFTTLPEIEYNVEDVARDVISGKYGNGQARKDALTAAGYDYNTVQAAVNKILNSGSGSGSSGGSKSGGKTTGSSTSGSNVSSGGGSNVSGSDYSSDELADLAAEYVSSHPDSYVDHAETERYLKREGITGAAAEMFKSLCASYGMPYRLDQIK